MRRRLLVANLLIIAIGASGPRSAARARSTAATSTTRSNSSVQRDASAVAALAGEIVENPGQHDAIGLAHRYPSDPGAVVVVIGPDGTELTPTGLITTDREFEKAIQAARRGRSGSGEIEGLTYATQPLASSGRARGAVMVARSDESIDHRVRRFWILLTVLAAGALAVSLRSAFDSAAGWSILCAASTITRTRLGRGELDARAGHDRGPPEVIALAATFNEMADRLDELVTSQRRFVADASHQLRTPLTALRLRLENLDPGSPASVGAARDAALDETNRLTPTRRWPALAGARAEGRRPERQPINISAALTERRDAWAPLAAEQGVELNVADQADVRFIALLVAGHLEQILDNLIDNALDASRPGDTVSCGRPRSARVSKSMSPTRDKG